MLPKERAIAAVEHREGDREPVGELHADHEVIEAAIGRSASVNSKWRELPVPDPGLVSPGPKGRSPGVGAHGIGIPIGSKKKDAACEFIK